MVGLSIMQHCAKPEELSWGPIHFYVTESASLWLRFSFFIFFKQTYRAKSKWLLFIYLFIYLLCLATFESGIFL